MDLVLRAAEFASIAHQNQRRKDLERTPYINHTIGVARILSSAGVTDPEVLAAALLHDTVEDTGVSPETLTEQFGTRVSGIVLEVTDDKRLDKVSRKKAQIQHVPYLSPEARLVKMADKLYNCRDLKQNPPAHWSPEEVRGCMIWSYAVCRGLMGQNEALDAEFQQVFSELQGVSDDALEAGLEEYYNLICMSE